MKIGLIDVDGHNFPNYALMKISAFHKANGDVVEWANPLIGLMKTYITQSMKKALGKSLRNNLLMISKKQWRDDYEWYITT
jgi:hypothetical protein